jgi:putative selenium metabolism hydrolase
MLRLGFDSVELDQHGSLIGIINGRSSGQTLLLDAHCDTVGIITPERWTFEPFAATIADGRMYGRGTSDMKGALAAMVYAAAQADRQRIAGRVVVSVTVLEEVLEGVALQAILDTVKPDYVVIGESTCLNLNHGGRGRAEILLEAIGKPAHSSNPQVGINAIHKIIPALQAIEAVALGHDDLLGPGIMALTDIISDPYPGYSVIPGRCLATYDRRLLVGETIESVSSSLQGLPNLVGVNIRVVEGTHQTYTGTALSGPKFFPAWKFPAEHPFVQKALAGLRAAGLNPALGAYRFCTNGASSAGIYGIPTIGFGPSSEEMAHIIDEYIEIDALLAAQAGYLGIINAVLSD